MDRVYVSWQAAAVPAVAFLGAVLCGHRAALGLLVATGTGAVIWMLLAVAHEMRTHGQPTPEPHKRDRALVQGLIGFVVPVAGLGVLLAYTRMHGVLFGSEAAIFGAVAAVTIPTAILVSSMFDRYLILPFCHGLLGPPIWSIGPEPSVDRRRRIAKVWVAHRAICEIFSYSALAILLAIIFVALGNSVSHERVLAVALESLSGTGVAVAILAYLAPRVRDSWNYMLADNAGLGTWAEGVDVAGNNVEGFVVDVAVYPGPKLYTAARQWRFVWLKDAPQLHEVGGYPGSWTEDLGRSAVMSREDVKLHRRQSQRPDEHTQAEPTG